VHKPITLTPKDGGKLATDVSGNEVGLQNYRVKRDWRRFLDRELRREGHDYFLPNRDASSGTLVTGNWTHQDSAPYYYLVTGFIVGNTYQWDVGNSTSMTEQSVVGNGRLFPGPGPVTDTRFVATRTSYYLWKTVVGGEPVPFPITDRIYEFQNQILAAPEPVNLLIMARSQQKTAVIAGTPTTLYRFFTTSEGGYVEDVDSFTYWDDYADDYVVEASTPEAYADDYFEDNAGGWEVIGSGFSAEGYRWEAVPLGGDVVFNNGVDLPVVYGLNEFEVTPLYELRENGVLSVRTITEFNSTLLLMDVTQAKEDAFDSLFQQVVLTGEAYQTGVTTSAGSYASQALDSFLVNITSGTFIFTVGMVGKTLRFQNGFSSVIAAYNSTTQVQLTDAPVYSEGYSGNINIPFDILNAGNVDSIVTADHEVFDSSMVGLRLFWDSGEVRTILEVLSTTQVVVEFDGPIPSGPYSIENAKSYGIVSDSSLYDRIRYRVINSALGDARRYNAEVPATIEAGSTQLTFDRPTRVFKSGMQILVVGAGLNGGNLLATIVSIGEGGKHALLDTPALATSPVAIPLRYDFQAQTYVEAPVIEGETYRFTPGANETHLLNGTETIGVGKFVAAGDTVKIYGAQPADLVVADLNYNDDVEPFVQITVTQGEQYVYTPGANDDYLLNGDTRVPGSTFTASGTFIRIYGTNTSGTLPVTASLIQVTLLTTATLEQISITSTLVQAADMIGSIVGFNDLEEDGSRIIRGMKLNDRLVLYRETGYQLGSYTGVSSAPFYFPQMVMTSNALAFKNTLITVTQNGVNFHLFAGANNFYRFDMTTRLPVSWGPAEICTRTFYGEVQKGATITGDYRRDDYIFSAENELTKEIFICFPSETEDKALCYDYEQGTLSTTAGDFSAAATVVPPGHDDDKWFIMGTMGGIVLTYGLANVEQDAWDGVSMYNRLGEEYDSEMQSGLGHFNAQFHEKSLTGYVLELSSFSPDTTVTVSIYGTKNPNSDPVLLATRALTEDKNFFPLHYIAYYLSDKLLVTGKDNPCEISQRIFNVAPVRSGSQTRWH
jgi:hypothetical protein